MPSYPSDHVLPYKSGIIEDVGISYCPYIPITILGTNIAVTAVPPEEIFQFEDIIFGFRLVSRSKRTEVLSELAQESYDWACENCKDFEIIHKCLNSGFRSSDTDAVGPFYLAVRFRDVDAVAFKLRWF
jgi:hypothetical protein